VKVKVRYFGQFRDLTEKTNEVLEVKDGITVEEIRDFVRELYSRMASKEEIIVAVNGTFVPLKQVIKENDDVAFFPPVSGG
jgi:molybdopterin synthase sulfur carrier subunit